MRLSAVVVLATCSSAAAFVPSAQQSVSTTQLQAENVGRREALGAFGAALGTALLFPESSNALENPALQTFKGRKPTKGAFIPGKGLHSNMSFDNLVALENPALQTFKGRKKTKGAFIPGKGLHSSNTFDELLG